MSAVSVILPVYNAHRTLREAVESLEADVLHAAEPDCVEVIAVNDGSTDGSGEMLDAMARIAPWLRVLHRSHGGIVSALNAGLAAARGTYIARMDADDASLPGRLTHQRAYLDAHPDIGLVGGQVEFGGDHGSARGYALHVDWLNTLSTPEDIMLARFIESPFAHPSVMFRRELVERYGGYRDGAFPEDYELWLRWMDAGVRMARVDAPVLRWNDPPARLSRTDARYSVAAFYTIKAQYLECWLSRENPFHPDVYLWGAGRITRQRVRKLQDEGVRVRAWVDIDPAKIGQRIGGAPVLSQEQLPSPGSCFILTYVGNRDARSEIASWLDARGYRLGVDYLPVA
ncbi:MAG: glycosyltransferase [Bacteroidetes bacterium]|nr:glycosyltransferase [Bacteroidota bacterium]